MKIFENSDAIGRAILIIMHRSRRLHSWNSGAYWNYGMEKFMPAMWTAFNGEIDSTGK